MVATVEETCRAIQLQMDLVWQKLPISHKFPEPLPLQSNVVCFQDRHSVESHPFSSIFEAVDFALVRTTLPITINGRPGGGKTSAMKWIARSFAIRRLEGRSKWLPVYVDLGQFSHLETGRWLASLIQQVMQKSLPVNYAPFQVESQNLLFLLDGDRKSVV